jgi:hypothetical protein
MAYNAVNTIASPSPAEFKDRSVSVRGAFVFAIGSFVSSGMLPSLLLFQCVTSNNFRRCNCPVRQSDLGATSRRDGRFPRVRPNRARFASPDATDFVHGLQRFTGERLSDLPSNPTNSSRSAATLPIVRVRASLRTARSAIGIRPCRDHCRRSAGRSTAGNGCMRR